MTYNATNRQVCKVIASLSNAIVEAGGDVSIVMDLANDTDSFDKLIQICATNNIFFNYETPVTKGAAR